MRNLGRDDLLLNGRHIPRDKAVAISSYSAHHDENQWNTGSKDKPHPLDEFWAERFVVYHNDSSSGPLKKRYNRDAQKQMHTQPQPALSASDVERTAIESSASPISPSLAAPRFSDDGLAGIWIPYGGGQNICPGRHFAKQEILLTLATLFSCFDMELIGPAPRIDWKTFGTGVLAPKGSVRFRIKRAR